MTAMWNYFRKLFCGHFWMFQRKLSDELILQRCLRCEITRSIGIVTAFRVHEGEWFE